MTTGKTKCEKCGAEYWGGTSHRCLTTFLVTMAPPPDHADRPWSEIKANLPEDAAADHVEKVYLDGHDDLLEQDSTVYVKEAPDGPEKVYTVTPELDVTFLASEDGDDLVEPEEEVDD